MRPALCQGVQAENDGCAKTPSSQGFEQDLWKGCFLFRLHTLEFGFYYEDNEVQR